VNLGNVSVSLPDHPLLILLPLEEQIRPLLLKEDKPLHAQEEADHVRITLEHFFLEFVTHIYSGVGPGVPVILGYQSLLVV
jgi:hypothetical protein